MWQAEDRERARVGGGRVRGGAKRPPPRAEPGPCCAGLRASRQGLCAGSGGRSSNGHPLPRGLTPIWLQGQTPREALGGTHVPAEHSLVLTPVLLPVCEVPILQVTVLRFPTLVGKPGHAPSALRSVRGFSGVHLRSPRRPLSPPWPDCCGSVGWTWSYKAKGHCQFDSGQGHA